MIEVDMLGLKKRYRQVLVLFCLLPFPKQTPQKWNTNIYSPYLLIFSLLFSPFLYSPLPYCTLPYPLPYPTLPSSPLLSSPLLSTSSPHLFLSLSSLPFPSLLPSLPFASLFNTPRHFFPSRVFFSLQLFTFLLFTWICRSMGMTCRIIYTWGFPSYGL